LNIPGFTKVSSEVNFCALILVVILTTCELERQEGLVLLQQAINKIEETILSLGGTFSVQMAVKL